eukprot:Rmarinus@m.21477
MHGADESPPVLEPAPAAHDCDMTGVDQFPPVPEPASAEHDCNAPGPTGESLPVLELAPAAHDCNVPGPGEVPVDSLQPSPLLHLIEQGRINPGQQNDECCSMLSQLLVSLNHTYSVQQTAIDALVEGLRDNIFPSLELCIISRLCAEVSIIRPDLGCIINDVLLKSYLRAKQVAQNEYNSISERVLHMAHSRYFQRKWTFPPDKKSLYTPEVYKLHEGRLSYGKSLLDSIHVLCQGSYFSNAFLEGLIELKSRAFQPAPDIITDLWDTAYVRNLVSERFNRAVDNEEDVDYDLCLPVLYYFDDIDLGTPEDVMHTLLEGILAWDLRDVIDHIQKSGHGPRKDNDALEKALSRCAREVFYMQKWKNPPFLHSGIRKSSSNKDATDSGLKMGAVQTWHTATALPFVFHFLGVDVGHPKVKLFLLSLRITHLCLLRY